VFLCVSLPRLQKLKHTESDKLQVQIQAYLDNVFDVGALLEDAETKNAALERVEELEENMSHVRNPATCPPVPFTPCILICSLACGPEIMYPDQRAVHFRIQTGNFDFVVVHKMFVCIS